MVMIELVAGALMAMAHPVEKEAVSIEGPEGPLNGVLSDPATGAPAVLLIPGSGPTDLDGDNAIAGKGKVYRQLSEMLAERGIATLRADKRGMFSSKDAVANPNDVTLTRYASDARGWVDLLVERGKPCVWLMGHSEGGLVALTALQNPENICGAILLASPGRPLGHLLREQLGRQLPAAMMADVEPVIAALEAGETPDTSKLIPQLAMIFNPAVQGYLIDLAQTDPAQLAAASDKPMLIVHFEEDLQVVEADADALAAARPDAVRVDLAGVNHMFKPVEPGNATANSATYNDASVTIDPAVADAVAAFVKSALQSSSP